MRDPEYGPVLEVRVVPPGEGGTALENPPVTMRPLGLLPHLGAILGAFWRLLGPLWVLSGARWASLVAPPAAILGPLGTSWTSFGYVGGQDPPRDPKNSFSPRVVGAKTGPQNEAPSGEPEGYWEP